MLCRMGAGQSVPSLMTHEKLYELTKDTRNIMNILLDYMLKEITVRDFLALSNPNECKKYVIFMANNLFKYFYELQIFPVKDKKGVIVFRPIKDFTNPSQSLEKEQQSLCLVLAYFYVRIFQIYGALALTLIDDVKFSTETGILSTYSDDFKRQLLPPGYRPYSTLQGGTISTTKLGNFNFLRSFLYEKV
jgi:hypothetical protein